MFISAAVKIDLSGLQRFQADVHKQLNGASGPVRNAVKLWAIRYRSWAQQRFDQYSRGGGDWAPLKASTIKRRRQGTQSNVLKLRAIWKQTVQRTGRNVAGPYAILRDTGLLFNALSPVFVGTPGAIEQDISFGIRVGYGGPAKHSVGSTDKSRATIADIAAFHQNGAEPHLPQRIIIADPPEALLNTMAADMTKALRQLST